MSSVPEITEAETTPKIPPSLSNSTKTTTSDNGQTSDQDETSKQDSTNTVNNTPKQDSTNSNPQNEPPKRDSPDDNPQDGSTKQEDTANTDPKQDSTISDPQNEPPKQDSINANPQNGIPKQETANSKPNSKGDSTCLPLPGLFPKKGAKSQFKSPAGVPEIKYSKEELCKSIEAEIKYIQDEEKKLDNYKDQVDLEVKEALDRLKLLKEDEDQDFPNLRNLQKAVTKLKLKIPKQKANIEDKDPHKDQQAGTLKLKQRDIPEKVMKQMPRLYKDDLFVNSPEFKDLEALFNQLPVELKLCLLCFSIFPGNEDIKKRIMVYWWMTEGFVPPISRDEETRKQIEDGKTAEEFADEFLEKLWKMGFIEPVNKKRSFSVGSYRMHPFISSALVMFAEKAKFFDFDDGEPTEKFSKTFQACLVGRGLIDYQYLREGKVKVQDLEKVHTVINVNEPILEFKKEWLLEMKNVNVLYLGRWKASATHHIEVEDEEEKDFLDGLQDMNHLKFFSLQGVSRIMELPESISKLSNLMILDLRACHNLESIPEKIGLLKNLTHLDISECYLLERMPKGIASLSELRVLKGFVVGEKSKHSCNLQDLAKLRKLIKLSIYTGLTVFPVQEDIDALNEFQVLRKLTIAWGGDALKVPSGKNTSEATKKADGGERKKENSKENQRGNALQAKSSRDSEPPKPHGIERKEKNKEIQGGDASKPQSSITTSEAPKPDGGEREKEKPREKPGESASQAQSSKTSEPSQADDGGERQKETPKVIQEEGDLKIQSGKSTTEAPKPDDGAEREKKTTKEIQEGDVSQAPSSKSTSEAASKPDSGGERKEQTTKETQGRDALQAPSSKSTVEAPKQDDGGKREEEKTQEKAKTLNRLRTLGKNLTFKKSPQHSPAQRLEYLEKLDLKSFPNATTPDWLMPSTLKSLQKLYIRGGKFSDLGQFQDIDNWGTGGGTKHTWKVERLRLKYLSELEMDWRELEELFPELVYLEKVNCPKLSFFPCDGYGVWINQIKLKQLQERHDALAKTFSNSLHLRP